MAIKKKIITNNELDKTQEIKLSKNTTTKRAYKVEILKHIMTGLSYMIPILVLYSLVRALEQLIPALLYGANSYEELIHLVQSNVNKVNLKNVIAIVTLLKQLREILFSMSIPLFAAFTANSIGGKNALILGFLGGLITTNPIVMVDIIDKQLTTYPVTPSGFLGAMIIALTIGHIVRYLNTNINVKTNFLAIKTSVIIPVTGLFACIFITVFIINPIISYVGIQAREILLSSEEYGEYIYSILVAIGTTFDFGGPINKTTGFVCSGFLIEGVFPVTARTLSVVIPPIGLGLSTIVDKYIVKRKVYNESFCVAGKTALTLGFLGISEGSLPFALENPKFMIPINIIGAILGTLISVSLGAVQEFPESAVWAWFFAENISAYVLGILVGSSFIALSNILYRNYLIKQGKLIV